jgi:hypothetical protein
LFGPATPGEHFSSGVHRVFNFCGRVSPHMQINETGG